MTAPIRPAEAGDGLAIRAVHLEAFPTPAEANLVEQVERDGDVVISLVAQRQSAVVGHVLLSRMAVSGDGRAFRALGLGPVAVLPQAQRSRLGSQLISGALGIAKATGEELIFVVGDPDFYSRFGFSAAAAAPFASPYRGPFLMALALSDRLVLPERGAAEYAAAFSRLGEEG